MKPSLSRRIFRTIFAIGLINATVSLIAVEYIYEDVEDTVLHSELEEEGAFLTRLIDAPQVRRWQSALIGAIYVPAGETVSDLPEYFAGRAAPYSEEVEIGPRTYLVLVHAVEAPPGTLYIAKDITLLEDREAITHQTAFVMGVAMILIGFLVARQGTLAVVRPLRALNREIRQITPRATIGRIEGDYTEAELAEIATTLNATLDALDAYVKREKSLVSLASHELRTPLAVIAGALDVLEQRGSLGEADRRTAARIRLAADEMQSDVSALLKLARRAGADDEISDVDLRECVRHAVAEIDACIPDTAKRVSCDADGPVSTVRADPALVRMLVRNLVQNAVRHTRNQVHITLGDTWLTISDEGGGLPEAVRERIASTDPDAQLPEDGLGLFIVRLICERLDWRFRALRSGPTGTVFELAFDKGSSPPPGAHL